MILIILLVFSVVGVFVKKKSVLFPAWSFAMALVWVGLFFLGPALEGPHPGCLGSVEAQVILGLLATLPIPTTMIGTGTGSLCNHPWRGAAIGFGTTFSIQLVYLV